VEAVTERLPRMVDAATASSLHFRFRDLDALPGGLGGDLDFGRGLDDGPATSPFVEAGGDVPTLLALSSSDLTVAAGDAAAAVELLGVVLRDGVFLPFKVVGFDLGDAGAEPRGEGTAREGTAVILAFLTPPYLASVSALIFGAARMISLCLMLFTTSLALLKMN